MGAHMSQPINSAQLGSLNSSKLIEIKTLFGVSYTDSSECCGQDRVKQNVTCGLRSHARFTFNQRHQRKKLVANELKADIDQAKHELVQAWLSSRRANKKTASPSANCSTIGDTTLSHMSGLQFAQSNSSTPPTATAAENYELDELSSINDCAIVHEVGLGLETVVSSGIETSVESIQSDIKFVVENISSHGDSFSSESGASKQSASFPTEGVVADSTSVAYNRESDVFEAPVEVATNVFHVPDEADDSESDADDDNDEELKNLQRELEARLARIKDLLIEKKEAKKAAKAEQARLKKEAVQLEIQKLDIEIQKIEGDIEKILAPVSKFPTLPSSCSEPPRSGATADIVETATSYDEAADDFFIESEPTFLSIGEIVMKIANAAYYMSSSFGAQFAFAVVNLFPAPENPEGYERMPQIPEELWHALGDYRMDPEIRTRCRLILHLVGDALEEVFEQHERAVSQKSRRTRSYMMVPPPSPLLQDDVAEAVARIVATWNGFTDMRGTEQESPDNASFGEESSYENNNSSDESTAADFEGSPSSHSHEVGKIEFANVTGPEPALISDKVQEDDTEDELTLYSSKGSAMSESVIEKLEEKITDAVETGNQNIEDRESLQKPSHEATTEEETPSRLEFQSDCHDRMVSESISSYGNIASHCVDAIENSLNLIAAAEEVASDAASQESEEDITSTNDVQNENASSSRTPQLIAKDFLEANSDCEGTPSPLIEERGLTMPHELLSDAMPESIKAQNVDASVAIESEPASVVDEDRDYANDYVNEDPSPSVSEPPSSEAASEVDEIASTSDDEAAVKSLIEPEPTSATFADA
ncbi:hypothetical protein HDU81_001566 [Chytriomyces hyalinus]|nr:hypothetical protein HDU81_001566 [Chytriomyces hyalinus]